MEDAIHARDDTGEGGEPDGNGSKSDHRRSKSGGILGGFLRTSKDAPAGKAPAIQEGRDDTHAQDAEGAQRGSSIATALRQSQGRPRKGSLRKAAMAKMRERSSSLLKTRPPTTATNTATATATTMSVGSRDDTTTLGGLSYEEAPLNASADRGWVPAISLPPSSAATTETPLNAPKATPSLLASPITSPVGPYASTTDEDEIMSFYRPSASSSDFSLNRPNQGPLTSLTHRRSNRSDRRASVTAVSTPAEIDLGEDWDYTETEWWGWVVLVATWIVFVVGMGSCLGVWSWAWDVGETPYAPPDLEDDATLPITGYYPALIVCTAVMSWVWVVISWLGMKAFRHAKVGVDG
ncbi:hypothetical protein BDW02DRAFT_507445 [Decorospora gaudefroyi]|uniref:Uncharacterized protein n=1 Tax=Decorospora gaudefroyi TaxID=184978 RepID=A0A6A5KAZ2_9PLEO|nr:hypothetical protein BDW02DRAFT_507445 [Decorospora gaudefroyi]